MENLTHSEVVALSKAVSDKTLTAVRGELKAGIHPINFSVNVKGTLRVLPDTEKTATCNIPWKTVAAILSAKMGCTRASAEQQLAAVIAEALNIGNGVGATIFLLATPHLSKTFLGR